MTIRNIYNFVMQRADIFEKMADELKENQDIISAEKYASMAYELYQIAEIIEKSTETKII